MSEFKKFEQMEKLHALILQQKTGTPTQLAKKLGIKRTNLYILMDELNSLNLPTRYSRKFETFMYEKSQY